VGWRGRESKGCNSYHHCRPFLDRSPTATPAKQRDCEAYIRAEHSQSRVPTNPSSVRVCVCVCVCVCVSTKIKLNPQAGYAVMDADVVFVHWGA
jgi:hypothetical protein